VAEDADLRQLLRDCLAGKPGCWRTFVAEFNRLIQLTVIRTSHRCGRLTPELADDLVQEVYLRLCANDMKVLRDFRSPEPKALYGLIRAVAVTVTLDHFRTWSAEKRGAGEEPVELDLGIPVGDPRASQAIEQSVLFEQIDRHLAEITPPETLDRDRRIFWLYFRQGFTAKDIAALPGVSLSDKGVESILHRLTQQLRMLIGGKAGRKPPGGKGTSA
jgi:RNA polymerase sigma-70 factor (ECF subfamily)